MAHIHDVYNTDERFVIDPDKRTITQKSGKTRLIRGDHNSECYAFEIPRYIDGHDMSTCNSVRIGYVNIASDRSQGESKGPYEVKDLIVDPGNDASVMFSWLLSRNTTKYAGTLNFSITFRCLSDSSVVEYEWSTDTFKGITVSDKIDVDGTEIVEDNVDILEQWRDELSNAANLESVLYAAQELDLDQQAQARANIGAADQDSLIEVFEDIDELKANDGGKTIIGVIDSHYYNFRFLNEERGATMAEIREAAQSKDKDIVIRLDLDNWQGTLQYMGLVNLTDDGSTYREVLLFSTIKMNNGVVNTADNIVSGTVQLEYWYTPLDPGDDMPPVAFVNCQFAEINLAPGASHAGSFMRVNEDGMWDVEKVDIIQPPVTASVGQTLAVKAIDENGTPTEWETIDGNPGIRRVESLDKENLIQLRDLETGPYVLYGWFSPFPNSDVSMTFDNTIVIVSHKDAGSHLLVLTGLNSKINFLEILVDETNEKGFTYTRTDFVLNDLHGLLSRVDELEKPKESVSIVDKVTGMTYVLEVINGTLTMSEVDS